jgi:hypothetical protein
MSPTYQPRRTSSSASCPMLCGTSLTTRPSVSCRLIGLPPRILLPQPGNALHASAGPAGAQARPAAPAGGLQPGQPGGMRQQLDNAVIARNRDDGPDPAAWQRKPLMRPVRSRAALHGTHDPILPCSGTSSPLCSASRSASRRGQGAGRALPRATQPHRERQARRRPDRRRQRPDGHRPAKPTPPPDAQDRAIRADGRWTRSIRCSARACGAGRPR